MEEEAEMAGITLDELFSVARYRGIGEASFPFVSLQEYVLYAYAINRDFSAAGPVFTEAWTAPEIKVSTATATVVWSKYYDGRGALRLRSRNVFRRTDESGLHSDDHRA